MPILSWGYADHRRHIPEYYLVEARKDLSNGKVEHHFIGRRPATDFRDFRRASYWELPNLVNATVLDFLCSL